MGSWSTVDEPRATEMALRKPEAQRHSLQLLESPAEETEPSGGSHCTLWFVLKFLLEPRSLCGLCEPTPLSSACVTRTLARLPEADQLACTMGGGEEGSAPSSLCQFTCRMMWVHMLTVSVLLLPGPRAFCPHRALLTVVAPPTGAWVGPAAEGEEQARDLHYSCPGPRMRAGPRKTFTWGMRSQDCAQRTTPQEKVRTERRPCPSP